MSNFVTLEEDVRIIENNTSQGTYNGLTHLKNKQISRFSGRNFYMPDMLILFGVPISTSTYHNMEIFVDELIPEPVTPAVLKWIMIGQVQTVSDVKIY